MFPLFYLRPLASSLLILGLTIGFSSLAGEEHHTGLLPPTAEEQRWADKHLIRTERVHPNRFALERVNSERKKRGHRGLREQELRLAVDGQEMEGASLDGKLRLTATPIQDQEVVPDLLVGGSNNLLPSGVDNSATTWFPPVGNQGSLGSCAAYSTTYYTMTYMVNRTLNRSGSNQANIFSPKFTYNLNNRGSNSGSSVEGNMMTMEYHGAPSLAEWPYDSNYLAWPTSATIWRSALHNRMGSSGYITGLDTPTGLAAAKQLLANGWIANYSTNIRGWHFVSVKNDPATSADDTLVNQKAVDYNQATVSAHAMTVVGYNDDIWIDINNNDVVDAGEKGAFKVVNSWGTGWGGGGFAWVSYDAILGTSAVAGANQTNRELIWWGSTITWMAARPIGTEPSLLVETTITARYRNQMALSLGLGPITATTPSLIWDKNALKNEGGAYAYDGTSTACPATFVLDATDIADSGGPKRWFAKLVDQTSGSPCQMVSMKLTDGNGNVLANASGTNPVGGLPRDADLSTVFAWANYQMPNDTTAPATITDLSTSAPTGYGVTLTWTSPGDDGLLGRARGIEIRRSTAVITAANYNAATVVATPPAPIAAGSPQSFIVTGLASQTTYWFAVKISDEVGNTSSMSNVASVTTIAPFAIITSSLPTGSIGTPYTATLEAQNGTPLYSWTTYSGFVEDSSGTASMSTGTPLNLRGTYSARLDYTFPNGFSFPIKDRSATQVQLRTYGRMSFLQSSTGEYLNPLDYRDYFSETTGVGEDVFVTASADSVTFRWKAHATYPTRGADGSLNYQATLYRNGDIRYTYGAIPSDQQLTPYLNLQGNYFSGSRNNTVGVVAGATSLFQLGSALPEGLTLSWDGKITGTPTKAGNTRVKIHVWDRMGYGDGSSATRLLNLTITETARIRTIIMEPLPGPHWWTTDLPFVAGIPAGGKQTLTGQSNQTAVFWMDWSVNQ